MNLSKVLKKKRDAEDILRQRSPQDTYFEDSNGGRYINLANLATKAELAGKSDINHVHTFLNLSDVPESYVADKIVKVSATADGLEFADMPSSASGVFDYGLVTDATSTTQDYGGLA